MIKSVVAILIAYLFLSIHVPWRQKFFKPQYVIISYRRELKRQKTSKKSTQFKLVICHCLRWGCHFGTWSEWSLSREPSRATLCIRHWVLCHSLPGFILWLHFPWTKHLPGLNINEHFPNFNNLGINYWITHILLCYAHDCYLKPSQLGNDLMPQENKKVFVLFFSFLNMSYSWTDWESSPYMSLCVWTCVR